MSEKIATTFRATGGTALLLGDLASHRTWEAKVSVRRQPATVKPHSIMGADDGLINPFSPMKTVPWRRGMLQ